MPITQPTPAPVLSISKWRLFVQHMTAFFDRPWKMPLIVLLAIVTVGTPHFAGPLLKNHYQLGLDTQEFKCLPHTLYLFKTGRVGDSAEAGQGISIEHGQYVSFVPHNNMMGREDLDGLRIVKIVAGLPGDVLEVKDDVAYINGNEWGALTLLSTLGASEGDFDRKVVVPDGQALLLGTTDHSYDGRYYGFIDQSEISAQAFPLF